MKPKDSAKTFRVGAFFNRSTKASREQVAGIFRFAGSRPDWELHLFTRPETAAGVRRLVRQFEPDGIISGHPDVLAHFRRKLRRALPCVLVDFAAAPGNEPAAARVMCDDHAIGAAAAEHFVRRGFSHFAFAGLGGGRGDSESANSVNRENGFMRALVRAGFGCAVYRENLPRNVLHYRDDAALVAWLKSLARPCAVFAHSDTLALSVLNACRKAKIAVPEQIAIMGVDNEESVCENAFVPLSSVEPDFAAGGFRAAEILDGILRGRRRQTATRAKYGVLRTVDRLSTQNVSGAHRRAAMALEHVRAHALEGIRAVDVAAALGLSPRTLELSFGKTFGRTVRDELLRARLDEARRLVRSSRMTSAEIAAACGFRTASAFKAIYKKKFGESPRSTRGGRSPR